MSVESICLKKYINAHVLHIFNR